MKIYTLEEEIDLGNHVLGVFSSKQLADEALDKIKTAYATANGFSEATHPGCCDGFIIEEHELNAIECESWFWKQEGVPFTSHPHNDRPGVHCGGCSSYECKGGVTYNPRQDSSKVEK